MITTHATAPADVLVTRVQAPNANAYAERWIRTVRAGCLDWLLIVGRGHLERVLRGYGEHYNVHGPTERSGWNRPIHQSVQPRIKAIHRRDRLGGLLHEYHRQQAS